MFHLGKGTAKSKPLFMKPVTIMKSIAESILVPASTSALAHLRSIASLFLLAFRTTGRLQILYGNVINCVRGGRILFWSNRNEGESATFS